MLTVSYHPFFYITLLYCQLATVSIFKISLIDPPIDAFDGGMSYFGIIWILKKIPTDGGVTLSEI